jgi:hypothetical protein
LNVCTLAVLLGLSLSAGGPGADEHLLAGAREFREARYAEALVEFRVAQRLGAPDASRYAAVALVKLGRPEEAIEAFGGLDGQGADALVDYYRAVAAYDARLYVTADRLLATIADRAGPRIGEQVARMRADIASALKAEPTTIAVDWYLDRSRAARVEKRLVLAAAFGREAVSLSERRSDRYRHADAVRGVETAKVAPTQGARP